MRSITQTNYQYSFTKIIGEKKKNTNTHTHKKKEQDNLLLSTGLWENLNIKMFPLSFSIHSLRVELFKKYNTSSFCTESKPPAIIFKTTESNRKTHPHQKSQRRGSMCHYLGLSIFQQGTFKFLSFGFLRLMTQASADKGSVNPFHFPALSFPRLKGQS